MRYTILLTGSTGNLGAYILSSLLSQPNIEHIICLNRSQDAPRRQHLSFQERGLQTAPLDDGGRVRFLQARFDDERLGLSEDEYKSLASKVDIVIHNAWPVDFNRSFQSFRPSIDGVKHLIRFCQTPPPAESANDDEEAKKLVFISSIGATSNWGSAAPSSRASVPEEVIMDWRAARTGYGQSKLVSERLICHAVATGAIDAAIIRVGQLGGPVEYGSKGKWPEHEWIPAIIKSSIMLGALPSTLGPTEIIDWVPVDLAARVIVDVVSKFVKTPSPQATLHRKRKKTTAKFLHVVNPHQTPWSSLVPAIQRSLGPSIKTTSFIEWVDALKDSVSNAASFRGVDEGLNPAGKLIDFFDNLQDRAIRFPYARVAPLDTVETVKWSRTLSEMKAVDVEWVELWMKQWNWSEEKIEEK